MHSNPHRFRAVTPAVVIALQSFAAAEVINVPADHPTIQAAVDASSDGDEIVVAPGTWTGSGDAVVDLLGKSITLRSSDGPDATVIDGQGLRRGIACISAEIGETRIEGFTVRNGLGGWFDLNADGVQDPNEFVGGGMLVWYANPTVVGCDFIGNTAANGGALYANFGSPVIESTVFVSNVADVGGACYLNLLSSPAMSGCIFADNTAVLGGAVYASYGSNVTMTGCELDGNAAYSSGGAIYALSGGIDLASTRLEQNQSGSSGGAVFGYLSTLDLVDCSLKSNTSNDTGGGIRALSSTLVLDACTLELNDAGLGGGGIEFSGSSMVASRTNFVSNAGYNGGGLAVLDGEAVQLDRCTFLSNNAYFGGGVTVDGAGSMDIEQCILAFNQSQQASAVYNGGVLLGIGGTLVCGNSPGDPDELFGAWTELAPNDFMADCPEIALGACCVDDTCVLLPQQFCDGDWGGAGSSCEQGCEACPGDFDGTGVIGVEDLLVVIGSWGTCAGCQADLTGDGVVGVEDLLIIIAQWGPCS